MRSRQIASTQSVSPPIYYVQPAQQQSVMLFDPAQLAEQRHWDAVLFARWQARQAAIVERDRRVRRLLLRVGVSVAVGLLLVAGLLGWLTARALAAGAVGAGTAVGGLFVGALVVAALGVGGHRCITIVKHFH
jgi:hypothetical protein